MGDHRREEGNGINRKREKGKEEKKFKQPDA